MKEYYTLQEILDSCGMVFMKDVPIIPFEQLRMRDLYVLMSNDAYTMSIADDITYLWSIYDDRQVDDDLIDEEIGHVWYDKSSFSDFDFDKFYDFIEPDVNNIFDTETYLCYAISRIVLEETIHPEEYIDSYKVTAYGSRCINSNWINAVKQIHKKYFDDGNRS